MRFIFLVQYKLIGLLYDVYKTKYYTLPCIDRTAHDLLWLRGSQNEILFPRLMTSIIEKPKKIKR